MSNRLIAYGSLLCGALTAATIPLVDTHPAVAVASFPFAVVVFAVLMLGLREWRPRRGRS